MTATDNARPVIRVDEITMIDGPRPVPAPAPVSRARTVAVRRVDQWSVLKVSLLFYLCVCLVLLVAGVVLWVVATATGAIGNLERFFQDAGFEHFRFLPLQLFRGFVLGGLILVVAGCIANVLLASLFNLISELVGGVRVTLADDEPEPSPPR